MKLKLNQTPRKNIASLFLCYKNFQKQKDEGGKAILLPASCDAGKNQGEGLGPRFRSGHSG
jgi:hypothetical protein